MIITVINMNILINIKIKKTNTNQLNKYVVSSVAGWGLLAILRKYMWIKVFFCIIHMSIK